MTTFHEFKNTRPRASAIAAGAFLLFTGLPAAQAQAQDPHAQHTAAPASDHQALADQIQALRQQVASLQATIQKQNGQRRSNAAAMQKGGMSMGQQSGSMSRGDMDEMGAMSKQQGGTSMGDMSEMSNMGSGTMPMGDKPEAGMSSGMEMMKEMGNMGSSMSSGMGKTSAMGTIGATNTMPGMAAESALPGYPGASHLYHVGATGFFLDHQRHITLTTEQRTRLNQIKEKALLDQASSQRKIGDAEQQLFALTGADQPDRANIEAQVKAIENLRAEQRLAYIRAVGEATSILTEQQRQALLGKMTASAK